jgi:hypothetical protein
MKTKLTLRVDEAVVRKAKRLAKKRGTSVSRIFGDYIATQEADESPKDLPPVTASMLGALSSADPRMDTETYRAHLSAKHA